MYENFSYEQLKALPDDQKIIALKELKSTYPDNRDLAKHLDVAHIAVSNMVGKYLEGKQVGRKKMTPEEKAKAKVDRELKKQQENQLPQTVINKEPEVVVPQPTNPNATVMPVINEPIQSNTTSFSIKLTKEMTGEEANIIVNGIAGTLLKDIKYKVSLVVEEV